MKYVLNDLIDIKKMQKLLDHLYNATGIASGIVGVDGSVLTASGWRDICTKYHRVNSITQKRCIESDTSIANKIKKGERYVISHCKNGLVDIGAPILIDGHHVATVFQGQFFFEKPDLDFFKRQAKAVGFNEQEYIEAIKDTPVIKEENIKEIVFFLTELAEFIGTMGYRKIKLQKSNDELAQSNEEITSLYEELIATEEELRSQCDKLRKQSDDLQELTQRYELIVSGAKDIIWDIDVNDDTVFISEQLKKIFHIDPYDINIIDDIEKYIHKEDLEIVTNIFRNGLSTKGVFEHEFRIICENKEIRWVSCKGKVLRDNYNNPIRVAGSFGDITDKKINEKKIEKMAYYDTLTGIYSRDKCVMELKKKLENIKENKSENVALFFLDINDFKNINDLHGHSMGDGILKNISKRIKNHLKDNELVARFGGDEFILLIYDYEDEKYLKKRASEILDLFQEKILLDGKEFLITTSIGITTYNDYINSYEELFRNADVAMYSAKKRAKNFYCFYNKSMHEEMVKRHSIEEDLAKAIKNNEFFLMYQPKINLEDNSIEGFEALIRWKHPEKGIISPGIFIPIAEESGLIEEIDMWVFKDVSRCLKNWDEKHINMGVISVNMSALHFKNPKLISNLKKIIKEFNIDTKKIQIEITENVFIESFDEAINIINEIKKLGFKIALDDFGKGYSSLNYLKKLPIDILKIDKSFISGIQKDELEVIDLIISLGHRLKLKVIAEGVETYDEYLYLKNNKCDYIQGYYFAKPMLIEEAQKYNVNIFN